MSKRSDAMKRKAKQMAKKNLAKARVQLGRFKARAKAQRAALLARPFSAGSRTQTS